MECDLFLVTTIEFSESRPIPPKASASCPGPIGDAPPCRVEPLEAAVIKGEHVVLHRLHEEYPLQLAELSGCSLLDRAPVQSSGAYSPDVVVEGGHLRRDPWDAVPGYRRPPVVVDASVAEHFEVLGGAAFLGPGIIERVGHADALERHLLDTVDTDRLGKPGGLEHGGGDVDDVVELRADFPLAVTPPGHPMVPLRVPPQCDATCLVHW